VTTARGNVGNQRLGWTGGLQIAILIGKPHQRAGVGDIYPLGIRTGRIEIDPECSGQLGEFGGLLGFAVGGDAAKYLDGPAAGIGNEIVAIGGGANLPGIGKPFTDVHTDLEPGGRLWHCVRRADRASAARRVARRRIAGLGKILGSDLVGQTGLQRSCITESLFSSQDGQAVGFSGVQHPACGQNQQSGGEDPVERFHALQITSGWTRAQRGLHSSGCGSRIWRHLAHSRP